jgi:hypothetical protein
MAGWRIGFAVGNARLIGALGRVKSYLDYGAFTPIQVAATAALNGPQDCIAEIRERYKARRDVLLDGLHQAGWDIPAPQGTMFAWAPIPQEFRGRRSPFRSCCLSAPMSRSRPGSASASTARGSCASRWSGPPALRRATLLTSKHFSPAATTSRNCAAPQPAAAAK